MRRRHNLFIPGYRRGLEVLRKDDRAISIEPDERGRGQRAECWRQNPGDTGYRSLQPYEGRQSNLGCRSCHKIHCGRHSNLTESASRNFAVPQQEGYRWPQEAGTRVRPDQEVHPEGQTLAVRLPVLTENLVSDCFGIDEWKALAKAARSTRRLRLKFSTRTLRCLPSYRFEDNRTHAFEESTVETY